jgi:hypothetical protein
MAELEARKMRYPTTGTEGLRMGILVEGEANVLRFCCPKSAFYTIRMKHICGIQRFHISKPNVLKVTTNQKNHHFISVSSLMLYYFYQRE